MRRETSFGPGKYTLREEILADYFKNRQKLSKSFPAKFDMFLNPPRFWLSVLKENFYDN